MFGLVLRDTLLKGGGNQMMRKGRYGVVNQKEYRLFFYNHQYYLMSTDYLELANGFTPWKGKKDVFIKEITLEELEGAYEVFPYVMLNSHRFSVEGIESQTGFVALVTSNPFVKKKMNAQRYGFDEYIVKVPFHQVAIKEDQLPILGF